NFQNRMPSANQLDSLQRLVSFMANRYGISPQNVIGHRDAPNARTDCPGRRFYPYLNTLRQQLGD
ncbi:MAG: N-acetylmuramoyl-L-alanine amidase, partial [Planctomycetes bacterium]|nr:N-acetylmuramoyl-L-alanine amidase [Planctomycetota bacterium]